MDWLRHLTLGLGKTRTNRAVLANALTPTRPSTVSFAAQPQPGLPPCSDAQPCGTIRTLIDEIGTRPRHQFPPSLRFTVITSFFATTDDLTPAATFVAASRGSLIHVTGTSRHSFSNHLRFSTNGVHYLNAGSTFAFGPRLCIGDSPEHPTESSSRCPPAPVWADVVTDWWFASHCSPPGGVTPIQLRSAIDPTLSAKSDIFTLPFGCVFRRAWLRCQHLLCHSCKWQSAGISSKRTWRALVTLVFEWDAHSACPRSRFPSTFKNSKAKARFDVGALVLIIPVKAPKCLWAEKTMCLEIREIRALSDQIPAPSETKTVLDKPGSTWNDRERQWSLDFCRTKARKIVTAELISLESAIRRAFGVRLKDYASRHFPRWFAQWSVLYVPDADNFLVHMIVALRCHLREELFKVPSIGDELWLQLPETKSVLLKDRQRTRIDPLQCQQAWVPEEIRFDGTGSLEASSIPAVAKWLADGKNEGAVCYWSFFKTADDWEQVALKRFILVEELSHTTRTFRDGKDKLLEWIIAEAQASACPYQRSHSELYRLHSDLLMLAPAIEWLNKHLANSITEAGSAASQEIRDEARGRLLSEYLRILFARYEILIKPHNPLSAFIRASLGNSTMDARREFYTRNRTVIGEEDADDSEDKPHNEMRGIPSISNEWPVNFLGELEVYIATLSDLEQKKIEMFYRHHVQGISHSELATKFGIDVGNSKKRCWEGARLLREWALRMHPDLAFQTSLRFFRLQEKLNNDWARHRFPPLLAVLLYLILENNCGVRDIAKYLMLSEKFVLEELATSSRRFVEEYFEKDGTMRDLIKKLKSPWNEIPELSCLAQALVKHNKQHKDVQNDGIHTAADKLGISWHSCRRLAYGRQGP